MITISATITIIGSDNNEQPPHAAKPLTHTKKQRTEKFFTHLADPSTKSNERALVLKSGSWIPFRRGPVKSNMKHLAVNGSELLMSSAAVHISTIPPQYTNNPIHVMAHQ